MNGRQGVLLALLNRARAQANETSDDVDEVKARVSFEAFQPTHERAKRRTSHFFEQNTSPGLFQWTPTLSSRLPGRVRKN